MAANDRSHPQVMTDCAESRETLRELIQQELERFQFVPTAAQELAPYLVEPTFTEFAWEYGDEGELRDCWIIAELPDGLAIGYSQCGFGSPYFWGLISSASFGSDAGWFATLEDCFLQSRHWTGTLPDGYEVA